MAWFVSALEFCISGKPVCDACCVGADRYHIYVNRVSLEVEVMLGSIAFAMVIAVSWPKLLLG